MTTPMISLLLRNTVADGITFWPLTLFWTSDSTVLSMILDTNPTLTFDSFLDLS